MLAWGVLGQGNHHHRQTTRSDVDMVQLVAACAALVTSASTKLLCVVSRGRNPWSYPCQGAERADPIRSRRLRRLGLAAFFRLRQTASAFPWGGGLRRMLLEACLFPRPRRSYIARCCAGVPAFLPECWGAHRSILRMWSVTRTPKDDTSEEETYTNMKPTDMFSLRLTLVRIDLVLVTI